MDLFSFFTGPFCSGIWQYALLPLVVTGGLWFTFQIKGAHLFHVGRITKEIFGKLFQKSERKEGSVTPFQSLCIALSGTVGTGSVIGTCQALAFGGPGALFWMWIAAFLGMVIKYAEVVLAVLFRRRDQEGNFYGGPMYYLRFGLGEKGKVLGMLYAFFALLSSFGMGCLAQANSVGAGVVSAVQSLSQKNGGEKRIFIAVSIVMGLFLAASLFGGAGRIGSVASFLVPFMGLGYVLMTLSVIFYHRANLIPTLNEIFRSAFQVKPMGGAAAGLGMKYALEWGLKRSAFSNEAGLGSAAIAHASAQTSSAVSQGFLGIFEVFFDTLVICSLTGLTILVALPLERGIALSSHGAQGIIEAVATLFGKPLSGFFIGGSLALFAFSTLLGWSLYGVRSVRFLFGKKAEKPYLFLFVSLAVAGVFLAMEPIWALSDLFNALMAIPNFIALFYLSGNVKEETSRFFAKKSPSPPKSI